MGDELNDEWLYVIWKLQIKKYCYRDYVYRLGYNPKYKEFPSPNEFINFDFSSRVKSVNVGEVVILENNYHKFVALKVTKVVKKKEDINHLLEFDYKIYKKIENV